MSKKDSSLSLRRISLSIALLMLGINSVVSILLYQFDLGLIKSLFILLVFSLLIFYLVDKILQRHVFQRLRVIYNIIQSSRKKEKSIDYITEESTLSIDSVNEKVVEWANTTSQEISELKKLENYRKDFVGNVSHELKTPIFNAQGFVHTLLEGGLFDEKINTKYLRNAAKNLDRLENIVNDLQVIAQLESREENINFVSFDLADLVHEVVEETQFSSKKKKHHVVFEEGESMSFMVKADREMIRQVLANLITNSIKYSEKRSVTKVNIYDLDSQILTEISDQGIGIDEVHHKHLFDRFYRVDSARSRDKGGSGLGLAIVKHILEVHGQNINVRSTVGVGSTFGFTLDKST